MRRDDEEEVDEAEEISLEDTQEYRVSADAGTEIVEEPEPEFEPDEYDDEPVYEDGEYVDEYYDDEEVDEPAIDQVDRDGEPAAGQAAEESISGHLKAAGAAAVARVRRIELPKFTKPDLPRVEATSRAVAAVAIALLALAVGIGAYFIGKGSGDDIDTARLEGAAAGKQAGAIEGAARGYAAGFQKGRDAGFDKAYIPAYKINYKRAFEQAGLDPPPDKEIDVPEP